MWDHLKLFFDTTMFAPHGICLQWEPELLTVDIISDAIIAFAYFCIPFALIYLASKRRDLEVGWMIWAIAMFTMACAFTHLFSIYTLWVPVYGLEGVAKAVTALGSILTAILGWLLVPTLLSIPSPSQLREAHAMLEAEGRQRREAEALLSHSQRMEAIGQLTGGVAHDFNNLLMVISGNLEMAQNALGKWSDNSRDRLARVIANAYRGAQRAVVITQRLLAFARKQPFDATVVNVNQLIFGISDFFRRTLGEDVQLEVVTAANLWKTETDPHQLEAAILNLVVNAKDAMPVGGKLTVETTNAYVDEKSTDLGIDTLPGDYVVISVTDSGRGMDKETADRAFEPFFSTKETGQGTGLGLSQVYGFAKQSGGFAKIESEVGHGTSVKIYLPRTVVRACEDGHVHKPPSTKKGSGQAILVVEDDDDVREYVVGTLVELNYRVLEARDAVEASKVFQNHVKEIDLVLTDVVMPGKNGRLLSEELLCVKPELKVVFMTGYSRDAIVHEGRLERGVELLQKPVTQTALANKLYNMLLQ
jgi:signal transduction histidine kinase/CheY-like chemotaxis protein